MSKIANVLLHLGAVVAGTSVAVANDWKTYRYPNEGFTVEFPGAPSTTEMKVPEAQFVRGIQYLATDDAGTEYLGQALHYQPSIRKNNSVEKILRAAIDGANNAGKCSIRSEGKYSFPAAVAREVVFGNCGGASTGWSRLFLAGDWLYLVLVIGKLETKTADTERFIKSFALIGK